jgi:hypothetical protein
MTRTIQLLLRGARNGLLAFVARVVRNRQSDDAIAPFRPSSLRAHFRLRLDHHGTYEARERGMRLLMANLTAAQREQLDRYGYFDVIGGETGRRYRIRFGRELNVDELDDFGKRISSWCFFPEGDLVTGDVMLSQKVALETFEREALRVSNRLGASPRATGP